MTDHEPLIELSDLAVGYDGEVALRNLDLAVHQGDMIGIVGPSGCGKTSLLRALMGDIETYAGSTSKLRLNGDEHVRIGYVPQVETVDWNFPITVEEVALLGAWRERRWLPWSGRAAHARAHDVLQSLGMEEFAHRPIRALSGGQQQRTFLARALISDPQLLLLDEPTSGVDIKTSHEILHELAELNDAGVTIVLTTHDLNGVASHLPRSSASARARFSPTAHATRCCSRSCWSAPTGSRCLSSTRPRDLRAARAGGGPRRPRRA